jgi:hypothetical protein
MPSFRVDHADKREGLERKIYSGLKEKRLRHPKALLTATDPKLIIGEPAEVLLMLSRFFILSYIASKNRQGNLTVRLLRKNRQSYILELLPGR